MEQYALYLRKSRADLDAEARGEGETLAKHRAALTEYARRRGLFIAHEYAEIVSGDWCATYTHEAPPEPPQAAITDIFDKQVVRLEGRLAKARELVETGIYTPSEYLAQKAMIEDQLKALRDNAQRATRPTREQAIAQAVPDIQRVMDVLPHTSTVAQKNTLLRSIIDHIDYTKTAPGTRSVKPESLLSIDVYPVLACTV